MTTPAVQTLQSVGVDYITATAYRTRDRERFHDLGMHLIEQSARLGNELCNYKANGYHGHKCGGVVRGIRHDTHIIRLSSDDAREHWREVYAEATNISRIDLQVTFSLDRADEGYIRDEHARAIASKQGRGRRREVELRWNNIKGDTLTLGCRTSDVFARVYDKGREQKSDPAGKLIRHEVEYKRAMARAVAERLHGSESELLDVPGLVSTYIGRFGVRTTANAEPAIQCARGRTTDCDVKRRWLTSAVRPSISLLVSKGLLREVLSDLDLLQFVTIKDDSHEGSD